MSSTSAQPASISQHKKRKLDDAETSPAERWHPKYPRHRGPEITLESSDHCLFRVTHELLRSHSGFFAYMFDAGVDCDEAITIDLCENDLALLLDLLRDIKQHETIMTGISFRSLGALITAIDKYDFVVFEDVVEAEIKKKLSQSPLAMFQLASDMDDVPLAKRALSSMTYQVLQEHFGTLSKLFRFANGIRLDWQAKFLRLMLCSQGSVASSTTSHQYLSIGSVDSIRFDLDDETFFAGAITGPYRSMSPTICFSDDEIVGVCEVPPYTPPAAFKTFDPKPVRPLLNTTSPYGAGRQALATASSSRPGAKLPRAQTTRKPKQK